MEKRKRTKKIYKKMKNNKTTGELSVQYMDYKKLNDYLGWRPKNDFTKTLPN